jgi:outer membrane protein
MPSLALLGNYGYATEYAFDGNEAKTWSAAAAISFPVFDGAETRALTGYARSRQRAQSLRVRNLETQVAAELELARQDATSRLAQIGVAETQFTLAREELELAEKRFEQGVADNREMIEAQGRLATAGDNLVEAVYLYNVSRVELARVAGDVRDILPATQ